MDHQKRRAVVHIGHEKTGSTSLQYTLDEDREALCEAGFLFPKSPGRYNHTNLVVACQNEGVVDNIKAHQLARQGINEVELRQKFEVKFSQELRRHEDWHTLIISSELITSRLHDRREIDRLLAILQAHVDEVEIILFLRRQDRLALSRFSSALRSGHSGFDVVFADMSHAAFFEAGEQRNIDDITQFYDYERILGRFENREGVNLNVHIYDQANGHINPVKVFYEFLGYRRPDTNAADMRLNTAISAQAQYVISSLNASHGVALNSGLRNEPYRALLREIEAAVPGEPRQAPREEAQRFYARFARSNTRVRDKYFAGSGTLFDDDFSSYPVAVDYAEMKVSMTDTLRHYEQLACALPLHVKPKKSFAQTFKSITSRIGLKL